MNWYRELDLLDTALARAERMESEVPAPCSQTIDKINFPEATASPWDTDRLVLTEPLF